MSESELQLLSKEQLAVKAKTFMVNKVPNPMSGSLNGPIKLRQKKNEKGNERLALQVIMESNRCFLTPVSKNKTVYSHEYVKTHKCHIIAQSLVTRERPG